MKEKFINVCNKISSRVESYSDSFVFLCFSIFYFVWRILTLPLFEVSGDAAWKWRFLRYFHETGVWFPRVPEHHQGRWAQNIPAYWLMEWFDSSAPWLASVLPILTGYAVLVLIWLIVRKFASRTCALVAIIITLSNPIFINESAQLLPSMPSTMYILLSIYIFINYIRKPGLWFLPLIAGFTMGFAWGCKVTVSYWALGMGLFLLFNPVSTKNILSWKRLRIGWDAVLFALGFMLVLVPETLIMNNVFGVKFGRLDLLHQHSGANPRLVCFNLLEYIFAPFCVFLNLSGKFINTGVMASLFLLAMPPAIIYIRKKSLPLEQKFLLFSMFIAMLCHCYLVVKIFPFKHPERPLVRYFLALFCVWSIVLVVYWRWLFDEIRSEKWKKRLLIPVGAICFVLTMLSVVNLFNHPFINKNNLFTKIGAYRCMAEYRKNNLSVLITLGKRPQLKTKSFKTIIAWESFFGESQQLPSLQKPDMEQLRKKWENSDFIRDGRGNYYFHLWGEKPVTGKQNRCMIVNPEFVKIKDLFIEKYEKTVEQQNMRK